jgi:GNAT superfamily N-acetyltransferase
MPDRVRLTLPSEDRLLPLVGSVVEHYAQGLEVPADEASGLVSLVADAVRFVLDNAYPGDPTGEVELTLDVVDGTVNVDVHDWGRPLAGATGTDDLPPGLRAIAEQTEGLRLINLGADGKRLSFAKRVSHVVDTGPEAHDYGAPARAPDHDSGIRERIEIATAGPESAESIAQLLYENYHLTYGHPDFYRSRWVAAELEQRTLVSSVALHEGAIVGHHALMLREGVASAESGVAVVHPAFRGLGIFTLLFDHTLALAGELGLDAVWGRAVTVHPFSQRSERSHGYREAALMLGSVPAAMTMAGLAEEGGSRTASILSYRMLRPRERSVFLPEAYRHQLRAAYANLGLVEKAARAPAARPDGKPVIWRVEDERQTGWLTVRAWDEAARADAVHATRHLLAHHVDVVYADVDLCSVDAIDAAVAELNELGFSYAGLAPSGQAGTDFLRLQLLNAENIVLDGIVADSPFAQALLDDVLEDRRRVDG